MNEQEFYTKTNFRKLTNDMTKTAEKIRQDKTVEDAVLESGIDFKIAGDHILIGSALEQETPLKNGIEDHLTETLADKLEREINAEDEQNRWMEQRESDFDKYMEGY